MPPHPQDLYDFIYEIDWLRYLPADPSDPASVEHCTLAVDVGLGQVPDALCHSHFTGLTVKNAIADQIRRRCGARPSVDLDMPLLPLYLHLHRGEAWLYRSLGGHQSSLHKRGYHRGPIHKAALRENLAAGLLLLAGWDRLVAEADGEHPAVLCDPCCGSGTLAVEAALIATRTAPGLLRSAPDGPGAALCFQTWPDFDPGTWAAVLQDATSVRIPAQVCVLYPAPLQNAPHAVRSPFFSTLHGTAACTVILSPRLCTATLYCDSKRYSVP